MLQVHEIGPTDVQLARLALDLGAAGVGGPLSKREVRLCALAEAVPASSRSERSEAKNAISDGLDPLGERLLLSRRAAERRKTGAFYTPQRIVNVMVDSLLDDGPSRFVDAGCGSGRFSMEIARRDGRLPCVAVDMDPLATLLTRAGLSVLKARASTVINGDYTQITLGRASAMTAFVSNPPYLRHHGIPQPAKRWAAKAAQDLGLQMSALSGLHVYFLLKTAREARPGDTGCFITSSEWMDVGYGAAVRDLLISHLGLISIDLIDPKASAFASVMSTAAIVRFKVGARADQIRTRFVTDPNSIGRIGTGGGVAANTYTPDTRWGELIRRSSVIRTNSPALGDVFRVHRGLVTGSNRFFVMSKPEAALLGLTEWSHPVITSADEIFESGGVIRDNPARKVVVSIPRDIDRGQFPTVDAFLQSGERRNGTSAVSDGYISSHRRPWWHLGTLPRPQAVVTYMARKPPAFALNPDGLAILNIAHGLYPRAPMNSDDLESIVQSLNRDAAGFAGFGRIYHGGLEKFEPKEMESLPINGAASKWLAGASHLLPSGTTSD